MNNNGSKNSELKSSVGTTYLKDLQEVGQSCVCTLPNVVRIYIKEMMGSEAKDPSPCCMATRSGGKVAAVFRRGLGGIFGKKKKTFLFLSPCIVPQAIERPDVHLRAEKIAAFSAPLLRIFLF